MVASAAPSTTSTPQLRPLNIMHDLPAVADLVESCFSDTMDAESHRYIQQMRRAGRDNAFIRWAVNAIETTSMPLSGYVWVENGQIIGNASLIPFRREQRKYYLIANVAVRPEYRRKGIGQALTRAAMANARQKHAHEIWLHVRDDNPGAIELYRRLGFMEIARRSTWRARPDRNASPVGLGITFTRNIHHAWLQQEKWLRRLYPDNLAWYQEVPWRSIRPGLAPALYRFFMDGDFKTWAAHVNTHTTAMLCWQPLHGTTDRLWAAIPQEGCQRVLTGLLLQARRSLHWRQVLTLELPAGEYSQAITSAGFNLHRTLLWMRAGETPAADIRTS